MDIAAEGLRSRPDAPFRRMGTSVIIDGSLAARSSMPTLSRASELMSPQSRIRRLDGHPRGHLTPR
ncbi:hypothetical protein D9M68_965850 [compost metagenome]